MWTFIISLSFIHTVLGVYVPGAPGAPWSKDDALIIKAKLTKIMKTPSNFNPLELEKLPFRLEHLEFRRELPYPAKHLRLGFHSCLKYTDGSGGCNGCLNLQKMVDSLDWRNYDKDGSQGRGTSGHEGLLTTVKLLEQVYTDPKFPPKSAVLSASMRNKGMSRADLYAFTAILAIEMGMDKNNVNCDAAKQGVDGNCIEYRLGNQRAVKNPNKCKVSMDLDIFETGRADCVNFSKPYRFNATKEEVHPNEQGNGQETIDFYRKQFNLTAREAVALQGAHSLGKPHVWNSGFDLYWTKKNHDNLNSQYFENIVNATGFKYEECPYIHIGDKDGNPAQVRWIPRNNINKKRGKVERYQWMKQYYGCKSCQSYSRDGKGICPTMTIGAGIKKTFKQICGSQEHELKPECTGTNGKPNVDCCITQAPYCQKSSYAWRITRDMMLSTDLGMYYDFDTKEDGRPVGCPGLDRRNAWRKNKYNGAKTYNQNHEVGCPKNLNKYDGVPLYQIVEDFAHHEEKWFQEFPKVIQKMLSNGYEAGALHKGPNVINGHPCRNRKGIFTCFSE